MDANKCVLVLGAGFSGMAHARLVDPLAHTLEVMSLETGRWTQLGRYEGEAKVRAAPFDAIELELGALWI
jgi:monoamine oxidase